MPGVKFVPFVSILALTLVSLSIAANDDHQGQDFAPSASPDGRHIVYYSYRGAPGDLSDLFVVDKVTGVERQLTSSPGIFEIEPQWSADGSEIYFAGGPSMKELALYSVNVDGSNYRLNYDGLGYGPPALSSDSERGLFWRDYEDGTSDLLIHDFTTGADQTVETGLVGKNQSPSWSHDERKILFSFRAVDENGREFQTPQPGDGLYEIDIHTRELSRLTRQPIAAYGQVSAPDGFLYFMTENSAGVMHIHRVPNTGGVPEQVSPDTVGPAYFPALSADSNSLLFSGRGPSGHTRILSMPLGGGKPEQVTHTFAP